MGGRRRGDEGEMRREERRGKRGEERIGEGVGEGKGKKKWGREDRNTGKVRREEERECTKMRGEGGKKKII